ncbi:hypothetical protein [Kitasatospora sp. GP82]|uniref:hypothetical protein n=1 Tax=Kitasatospora sp. GP82 TaxID=3035089 RepID=UPI0024732144|nr:hypothetical protein [Kitasatospora sp. GP82]MDH6129762.1 hypothetical protein [Kitasatospora sp. GP82]
MSIDAVTRLRLLAAGLHTTMYAEERLEPSYDKVWAVASDLAGELPYLVPLLREFRIPPGNADRKGALAMGPLGCRSAFEVRLAPGWCLMRSRLVVGGMAAVPEGDGTRFAMLGAARPAALRPVQWAYARRARHGRTFVRKVAERAALRS